MLLKTAGIFSFIQKNACKDWLAVLRMQRSKTDLLLIRVYKIIYGLSVIFFICLITVLISAIKIEQGPFS